MPLKSSKFGLITKISSIFRKDKYESRYFIKKRPSRHDRRQQQHQNA